MRRVLLAVAAVLVVLLAVNTIVMDRDTDPAKADVGRIIDLPGGDLQVREDGPRGKPNIVLLHGFACSIGWWRDMIPALARDHHVITFDLLGHGGSEKPKDGYGMEEQARRVSAALDRLGVRRATIIGHSMGGMVAAALTELRRPLVASLVLLDTASGKDDSTLPFTARLGFVPVLGEAIRRVVPDAMIRTGLEQAFADGFDVPDRFVDDVRDMTYTSYDDSRAASEDYRDERGVAERLADAKVPVPLLVIFGSQDDIAKPESAADYKVVPGARIVLMDGAGHSPHVEKPAATARLIRNFLDQRPAN
jgi:pimeloyl-ACP methyl ester carboxylesterase